MRVGRVFLSGKASVSSMRWRQSRTDLALTAGLPDGGMSATIEQLQLG